MTFPVMLAIIFGGFQSVDKSFSDMSAKILKLPSVGFWVSAFFTG